MPSSKIRPLVYGLLKVHGPQSISELAVKADCSYNAVMYALRSLKKDRKAYISGWVRPEGKGSPTALWTNGRKQDALKPAPYTYAELQERYRARKRAENRVRSRKHPPSPFEGLFK